MTEKEPGYVYILTNPSFREDWVKIGNVPLPFEIFATMKTTKYNEVEKLVHKTIAMPLAPIKEPSISRITAKC